MFKSAFLFWSCCLTLSSFNAFAQSSPETDSYANVTVLFADIVGFTAFSQLVSPEVMVGVLNDIFTRFDHIAVHRGL